MEIGRVTFQVHISSYHEEVAWLSSLIRDWWANRLIHERADGVDLDTVAARLYERAHGVRKLPEYAEILRDELWTLGDGHLRVGGLLHSRNAMYLSNAGFSNTIEGDVCLKWLSDQGHASTPANVGDALRKINGLAPEPYFASVRLRPGSSTWQRRWLAINSLSYQERFAHEQPPSLELVLERVDGSTYPLRLEWTSISPRQPTPACVTSKPLGNAIGYLAIQSFYCCDELGQVSDAEFQRQLVNAMALLGPVRDLVIDLRWNSGGRDEQAQIAASIFGKTRIEWFRYRHHRPDIVVHDSELQTTYLNDSAWSPPVNLPTTSARPWLLIGPGTFSTAEVFAAALRKAYAAVCLGDRSGGGAGNPVDFRLPYSGLTVTIPVSEIYMAGDGNNLIEAHGIVPDTIVPQNVTHLRAGRDTGCEAAMRAIVIARGSG